MQLLRSEEISEKSPYPGRFEKPVMPKLRKEVIYPERDGKHKSDNTRQFNWIVKIKEGLEILFADRPDVFVAGDLLWYPVEGNNRIRIAPDAMVAFGRPKGDRGSYRQWEEGGIAPQVVFEVLSPILGIRFGIADDLVIFRPDGQRFLSPAEMEKRNVISLQEVRLERQRAEQERLRADMLEEKLKALEKLIRLQSESEKNC